MSRRGETTRRGRPGALDRRALIGGALILAASRPALGADYPAQGAPFTATTVKDIAAKLAQSQYAPPASPQGELLKKLHSEQYHDVRFRVEHASWRGENAGEEVQFFPLGWLYDTPIDIYTVENGTARAIAPGPDLFSFGPLVDDAAKAAMTSGFSGFRLHRAINRPDFLDEFVVFQGASYFRAVARGLGYGMSARALAIRTAQPTGEEFPIFRTFWIEKPQSVSGTTLVHALLDLPSTTGAYRFAITAGATTVMRIDVSLFPRRSIEHAGIAPLTSMFLYGPAQQRVAADYRPAAHDSEGLAIANGKGERIWRPLTNPRTLQVSSFLDVNPRGFGLLQRDRRLSSYEDLDAHYERRPSCWVEPLGDWGEGSVDLIEIPTDEEIHDNIVAYWRPRKPISPGQPFELSYRLLWLGREPPEAEAVLKVVETRRGAGKKQGQLVFAIDFADATQSAPLATPPRLEVKATNGDVIDPAIKTNPAVDGYRVTFEFAPGAAELSELRLALRSDLRQLSETWIYRWVRE